MTHYGIFNDEGLLEDGFYSQAEAIFAIADRYSEDDAHSAEICGDHPEYEAYYCEECHAEEN